MKNGLPLQLIGMLSVLSFSSYTAAQPIPVLPGSVQPSQVGRAIKSEQPVAPSQALPPIMEPQAPAAKQLPLEAQKLTFKLNGVILKGNHVYTTQELKPLYQKYLNQTISIAKLFEIVQNITNYYRNNKYILSRAILPPQRVKDGVVTIQIIEGYIANVEVTGEPKKAKRMVERYGEKIKACPPLDVSVMERYMYLANEIPGTQVRAVLAPSKKETAGADLSLVTEIKRYSAYFSYDNYGTRYIGPQQMTGNITANSFLVSGDTGQITFAKTPKGQELTYTDVNYNLPVSSEGNRLLIGGTRVKTHPLFILAPADIDGINENYYTMLYFPVIRERSQNLTYRFGFNYLDSFVTTFDEELYTDHLRSLDLGFTYNFADRWQGNDLISADIRQGLPIWGYTSDTNVNTARTSRPGGHGNYTKIAVSLSKVQPLSGPWSAYGILQGQWALYPLLAPEQFTFGGPILGRGYDVAEFIGDQGSAGSLELRYDYSLPKLKLQSLQFYAFYDAGIIWNFKKLGDTPKKASGTSTGFGVRFTMTKYISGNLMWAQVLTKPVAAEEFIGEGKTPRVFFSVVAAI